MTFRPSKHSNYGAGPGDILDYWTGKVKSALAEEDETDPLSLGAQQKESIPPGTYEGGGGYYYRVSGDGRLYLQQYTITGDWQLVTDKTAEDAIRNSIANKTKLTQEAIKLLQKSPRSTPGVAPETVSRPATSPTGEVAETTVAQKLKWPAVGVAVIGLGYYVWWKFIK